MNVFCIGIQQRGGELELVLRRYRFRFQDIIQLYVALLQAKLFLRQTIWPRTNFFMEEKKNGCKMKKMILGKFGDLFYLSPYLFFSTVCHKKETDEKWMSICDK